MRYPCTDVPWSGPITTPREQECEAIRRAPAYDMAAARADRTELGRPKGGTSEGRRAKDPLTASEEWMQRAEAAANELGGVCMVVQAELLLANPDRLRVVRAHVKDCLAVLDGLVDKSEAL